MATTSLTSAETIGLRGGFVSGNAGWKQSNFRLTTENPGFFAGGQVRAEVLPLQVEGSYHRLSPGEIQVSSMAGYDIGASGSSGHILAGYGRGVLAAGMGWALQSYTLVNAASGDAVTFDAGGPAVGAFWNLPVTGRLQLAGEIHYTPEATVNANMAGASVAASTASILGYEARGSFQLLPGVALEGGYRNSQLNGEEGYTINNSGIFAGAGIRL